MPSGGDVGAGGDGEDKANANARGMLLSWWAARVPDRPALITAYGDRTFGELNANANRLARTLRAHGLTAGDSIALMCTNRPEFVEVLLAAQRTGLRLTPINWHLTGEEAGYIVENCEAKAFIVAASLGDKVVVASGGGSGSGSGLVRMAVGGSLAGFESYEEALAAEDG